LIGCLEAEACTEGYVRSAGDGCNTCRCEDGAWVCTDEACPEPECGLPDGVVGPPCEQDLDVPFARVPGTDACCEHCSTIEGYDYHATRAACEAARECTQGQTKLADDGCNTCTCWLDRLSPLQRGTWQCSSTDCAEVRCGGFAGDSCAENEYCAYQAWTGEECGASDVSSVCRARPTECVDVDEPVCGCDGETYSNSCVAAMAGTGVMSNGPCEAPPPN
jgi:hypothetical protein